MAMAMGRSFRVYHNPAHVGPGNPYSLVLEQKGRGQEDLLLIENYSVTVIGTIRTFFLLVPLLTLFIPQTRMSSS